MNELFNKAAYTCAQSFYVSGEFQEASFRRLLLNQFLGTKTTEESYALTTDSKEGSTDQKETALAPEKSEENTSHHLGCQK